jgi:c-di-GMP-binding flagellar brake protein YcgR
MTSVPGVDHPEEQSEAEVTLAGRGISVSSRVERVRDDVITVRPSVGEFVDQVVVQPGDVVEIFWRGRDFQRALPAEVIGVEQSVLVRWRLRRTGPTQESQRRQAVRGRVSVPVQVEYQATDLKGTTVDLSEAGIRAAFEGFGVLPEAGTELVLALQLEDGPVKAKAEVVRTQARGTQWLMSIRFVAIAEKEQDRVRRRVFQALREERARTSD